MNLTNAPSETALENTLEMRLNALEQANTQLQSDAAAERNNNKRERRRLRVQTGLAFAGFVAAVLLAPANRQAIAQGYGVTLATLNTRLLAVENKTQFQTADASAKTTAFTACNVVVQNGLGTTSGSTGDPIQGTPRVNGLGNLIIGYNVSAASLGGTDTRTGSHNLILGDANNYSSYGGIVSGELNATSAPYASVGGGFGNTASGSNSAVSGGTNNTAGGDGSAISGGDRNSASSLGAAVSGGSMNAATGVNSVVSGGYKNRASANSAAVSGGYFNLARAESAVVSGGQSRTASVSYGWSAGSESSPPGLLTGGNFASP